MHDADVAFRLPGGGREYPSVKPGTSSRGSSDSPRSRRGFRLGPAGGYGSEPAATGRFDPRGWAGPAAEDFGGDGEPPCESAPLVAWRPGSRSSRRSRSSCRIAAPTESRLPSETIASVEGSCGRGAELGHQDESGGRRFAVMARGNELVLRAFSAVHGVATPPGAKARDRERHIAVVLPLPSIKIPLPRTLPRCRRAMGAEV